MQRYNPSRTIYFHPKVSTLSPSIICIKRCYHCKCIMSEQLCFNSLSDNEFHFTVDYILLFIYFDFDLGLEPSTLHDIAVYVLYCIYYSLFHLPVN